MENKTRERIIWAIILVLFVAAATVGACSANAAPSPQQVHAVIQAKDSTKTKTKAEPIGTITVEKKDGNKTYTLYKGSKGGYFYYTGEKDKNGRDKRRYLTKEEKAKNGLKWFHTISGWAANAALPFLHTDLNKMDIDDFELVGVALIMPILIKRQFITMKAKLLILLVIIKQQLKPNLKLEKLWQEK